MSLWIPCLKNVRVACYELTAHSQKAMSTARPLQAVARAIRSIETVTGTIVEYDISKDDAELLCSAMSDLWLILESNGYNMDNNGMGSVSNYCTVSG